MKTCFKCGTGLEIEFVGRREECPQCGADVRVCLNCDFYEEGRPNSCREPQAEQVKEKDRSNFCGYFRFKEKAAEMKSGKEEAGRLWKELFKKA